MASEFYDPTLTSSPQIKTTEIKVFSNNNQTYREKQKIIIQIPKEVQFIDPANTRLLVKLDFNNDLTGEQLNVPVFIPETGGLNSMFSRCVLYAGDQLLEDISGYDYYCNTINAYCKAVCDQNKDSIVEGVQPYPYEQSKQVSHNLFLQCYNHTTMNSVITDNKNSLQQNLSCNLKCALFTSHKIYFNAGAPLRLELTINKTDKCVKMVDLLRQGNTKLKLAGISNAGQAVFDVAGSEIDGTAAPNYLGFKNAPLQPGNVVNITSGGNTDLMTIQSVTTNNNLYRYTCTANFANTHAANTPIFVPNNQVTCNIQMKDVCLICNKVEPPQMWIDNVLSKVASPTGYNFDVSSVLNSPVSIATGQSNINCYIPTIANRVKSILAVPIDTTRTNTFSRDINNGVYQNYDTYSWFYESQQNPSEEVDVQRYSQNKLSNEHLWELEKTFKACNYDTKRLDYAIPGERNRQYFAIGRALTPVGSQSLLNRDLQFRLKTLSGLATTSNLLWNFYIHSIRRIKIDLNGVRVIM